ncbi:hypothetical protein QQ045_007011 [Rhodiola kirilowii]
MAFQGFKNAPGPCRPPTSKIFFGSTPPPSTASESLFDQSPPPPQQQPSALLLFSPAANLPSSFPLFSFGNTSRDIPAKDDKQHTELKS